MDDGELRNTIIKFVIDIHSYFFTFNVGFDLNCIVSW